MGDFVVEKTPHPSTGDQQLEAISVICELMEFTFGNNNMRKKLGKID
ncbi:MAG: hypothetical protein ACLTHH_07750 [Eubacterium sp.]